MIEGLARPWRASELWTPDYFKSVAGDARVKVYIDREGNPDYETSFPKATTEMRFANYVGWVTGIGHSNDWYIHAQNDFMKGPAGERMMGDLAPVPDYLDASAAHGLLFWYGPAGTVTPLHHDNCDIMFTQIAGRKRFVIVSPEQSQLLYSGGALPTWASAVDPESPDLDRHPLYAQAAPITVTLEPGDALFLPHPWWHHVRALDMSVSVSFTAFR